MTLTPHFLASLISLVALVPTLGRAAESADAKLVLLGVHQQGHPHADLGRAIERRLDRIVEPYHLPRPALTAEERTCRALECLIGIAQRQQAERLLGGEMASPMEQLTVVTLWLFDVRSRQIAEEEARCEHCDASAMETSVASATARLLEKNPAGTPINTSITPVAPVIPLLGMSPPSAVTPASPGKDALAQRRQTRLIVASLLGTVLAGTLITSISLTAVHTLGNDLCLVKDNMKACGNLPVAYGAGYALSAALAAGLTITLALPVK